MINIQKKENCCGCNACGDVCPKGAITFVNDQEGFWYPQINQELCIDCKLCETVCPVVSPRDNDHYEKPKCYAAVHKSIDVVFSSTSGGLFTALAEAMYRRNGYVGGAIHNDDFSVSHFISNDKEDLKRLRRSKDLQSNAEGFYKKVKQLLEEGKSVLVCGVPCQISAIRSFLGRDYDRLILVEVICLGVNSPKVWRKYLDYIEEKYGSKIISTENKSKEYGWRNLTQKFVFEDGNEAFDTRDTSLFTNGFISTHLYCRPSCYECKFKGFPRNADITIGDYWSLNEHDQSFNNDMGISVVLVNSPKGEAYFEEVKKRLTYKETPLEWAVSGNPTLNESITRISDKRDEFFKNLDKYPFDTLMERYLLPKSKTFKDHLRIAVRRLKFCKYIVNVTRLSPRALYQTFRYSGIRLLIEQKGIICGKNTILRVAKSGRMQFDGLFVLGKKGLFPNAAGESLLFVGNNASFKVLGDMTVDCDCDIEVFDNAELIFHGAKYGVCNANKGLTVICGEKIEVLPDVGIGRNVTIRDTNGNHYMNTLGYRTTRPIRIGEKAWLCEACTIMPGAKIGRSAIVGAHSVVSAAVADHTLVAGSPAAVVEKNVIWKC